MADQLAKQIFQEYKVRVEAAVEKYNFLKMKFPQSQFPAQARLIGKFSALAETWGIIATKLGGNKINYIKQWRNGGENT